jgi:hypothetical protein
MNFYRTLVWPRYANGEEFYLCMLPLYLDEEAFYKEVMSWPGVNHNLRKLGMHYVLPVEMLKKRGHKTGVGLISVLEV